MYIYICKITEYNDFADLGISKFYYYKIFTYYDFNKPRIFHLCAKIQYHSYHVNTFCSEYFILYHFMIKYNAMFWKYTEY